MNRFVEIVFDCLPLRSISRRDVPIDASPRYQQQWERVLKGLDTHGAHNSYYLYNATSVFHLTNQSELGMLEFSFEGTVLTDSSDQRTDRVDLKVELVRETCDWLTEPVVRWFHETVLKAVRVEFDRYIAAGDLEQTLLRLRRVESQSDRKGGYLGMGL